MSARTRSQRLRAVLHVFSAAMAKRYVYHAFHQLSVASGRSTDSFQQLWDLARHQRDLINFITRRPRYEKPVSMRISDWPDKRCQLQIPKLRQSILELESAIGQHHLQISFPAWLKQHHQKASAPPPPVALKHQQQPSEEGSAESPQTSKKHEKQAHKPSLMLWLYSTPSESAMREPHVQGGGWRVRGESLAEPEQSGVYWESFCKEMDAGCVYACTNRSNCQTVCALKSNAV